VAVGHGLALAISPAPGLLDQPGGRAGQAPCLPVVSAIQTIPKPGDLGVLITVPLGGGAGGQGRRSFSALTLYALLPLGAGGPSPASPWCRRGLKEAAMALAQTAGQRLWRCGGARSPCGC